MVFVISGWRSGSISGTNILIGALTAHARSFGGSALEALHWKLTHTQIPFAIPLNDKASLSPDGWVSGLSSPTNRIWWLGIGHRRANLGRSIRVG